MSKMYLANWTKMTVVIGGTGNITLGAVTGYPAAVDTIGGTNRTFHYVLLTSGGVPIEAGIGVMTDLITLRRDSVYHKMVNGVFTAGVGLAASDIPAGAVLYTAATNEMLLDLIAEMPMQDYGNVSGALAVNIHNKAIKLNLTADATLSFTPTPPAGVKYEFTIHATSANAGDANIGKGFALTLPNTCYLDKNLCPPLCLTHDSESVIQLSTVDGGASYKVTLLTGDSMVKDMGNLTGNITLDIRHKQSKGQLVAGGTNVTVTGVSPTAKFGEPAHFTFFNNSEGSKTLTFDAEKFTLLGSVINQITIPLGYKADFTVRRNPHANDNADAYDVWVNGINYNQTASLLATTWNPSDYSGTPPLTLSNSNLTIEMTTIANAFRSARAFGGKNAGKWYYTLRCDGSMINVSNSRNVFAFGVASIGVSLSSLVGSVAGSASLYLNFGGWASSPNAATYDDGVVTSRTLGLPSFGATYSVLFDASTGNGWFLINESNIFGGNPEAGTGAHFSVLGGVTYYPMVTFFESGTPANAGIFTMLNELQSESVGLAFPSWAGRYWTA